MTHAPLDRSWSRACVALVAALLLLLCAAARAAVDPVFEADVRTLAAAPSRVVGSPGYFAAFDYLRAEIARLPNVQLRSHRYDVTVPVTRRADMSLADGTTAKIYPFFPAGVRVNSTPAGGLSGALVYCGKGSYAELPAARLRDNIAVIEAAAGEDWKNVVAFGPRAILVLGGPADTHVELRGHELIIPANLPRFYLPDGPLAAALRAGKQAGTARLDVSVTWETKRAENLYALVLPARGAALPTPVGNQPWAAVMVTAAVDSSSLVPDLSPGAGQAVQPAAALAVLRAAAVNPPRRPLLIAFTGADSYQLLGSREMFMALAEPPAKWQRAIDQTLTPLLASARTDLARLAAVANDFSRLDVVADRSLIDRVVKLVETDLAVEQDRLFRLRLLPEADRTAETRTTLVTLEDRQLRLGRFRFALSKNPRGVTAAAFQELSDEYAARVRKRLAGDDATAGLIQQLDARRADSQQRVDLYVWLAAAIGRRADPGLREFDKRLIELQIGLDLSDRGVRAGPVFWGQFMRQSNVALVQEYREWFERLVEASKKGGPENAWAAWYAEAAAALDFESLKLTRSPLTFMAAPLASGTEMAASWGVPSLSLVTLEDLRLRRDTPADTLANLDLSALEPQRVAINKLIETALADPRFKGQPEFRRQTNDVEGQVVSASSGRPIPDLPREGFLATYFYTTGPRRIPQLASLPFTLGVRRSEVRKCDAEGRYQFDGLTKNNTEFVQPAVKVYRVDDASGAIVASSDLGKQSGDIKSVIDLRQELTPLRSLVFDCAEFTVAGLYDPRFLQSLGEVQLLDARRNADVQRFDAVMYKQILAGQLEPGTRAYLLFRYGRVGNRVVLLNMPAEAEKSGGDSSLMATGRRGEGDGYAVENLRSVTPLALTTARDFFRLDETRLSEYRKAGVSSTLIDALHDEAGRQLTGAASALAVGDGAAVMRDATGAWANEARVYDATLAMAADVVRAAIFLLLLAVPFSFCMERLLIGTPSVYKQLAGAGAIFAVMAAALWAFHPAFKISSSPLIIILAFAIILMSSVVIVMVYGKFDGELKRLRSGRGGAAGGAGADGASVARASVMMSAVMLGIANMRRRKFRTILTSTTIVLITFAVLCFTSASRYQGTISLPTGVESSHAGVLLRQRGFRPMPVEAVETMRAIYPAKTFVERWWTLSATDPKEQVHLVAGGASVDGKPARVLALPALLGLSPGESTLGNASALIGVIGPEKFARLENGAADVIYLSKQAARQVNVAEGDVVRLGGIKLTVAGLYDATAFDQRVRMLSGEPIAPLKYQSDGLDAGGRRLDTSDATTLDLDAASSGAEASASYEHLPAQQFAIVPAVVARQFENTTLRTVGVNLADDAEVKSVTDDLTRRFALATFAGFGDGVKLVASGNLASLGGGSKVAVPLAIGGLIIFNTMMGSIAERRKEIHIYTSLGLAPMHVGALFIAEALTYGLIGSVFGYIIGQGVGTLLLHLGWLGNVTLNYSGTSAMFTLGLILLIVLLSALVPARLASKIAAPSIDRSWKVPPPKGDEIVATLPFTINRRAAEGVLAYLAEFFEAHQEGSIGKFSAGPVEAYALPDAQGRATRALKTIVWLTPFDLGVRQHLMLLIHPGEFPDIYEVQVLLQRLSGDDRSWYRMNRTFLTELRKQFLQWRGLTPGRMKEYVRESGALFGKKKN